MRNMKPNFTILSRTLIWVCWDCARKLRISKKLISQWLRDTSHFSFVLAGMMANPTMHTSLACSMPTEALISPSRLWWNPLGDISNIPFHITDTHHMFVHSASSVISWLKTTMTVNTVGVNIRCTDGANDPSAHLPPPPPLLAHHDDTLPGSISKPYDIRKFIDTALWLSSPDMLPSSDNNDIDSVTITNNAISEPVAVLDNAVNK